MTDPAQSAPSAEPPFIRFELDKNNGAQLHAVFFGDRALHHFKADQNVTAYMADVKRNAEAYAALRTAQLERELQEFRKLESLPFSRSKMIARAETAESALRDAREKAIQECITIADERAKVNRVHALKFTALDQKNMYERALANAGEAERISDSLRALLTVAAQTPQVSQQAKEEK